MNPQKKKLIIEGTLIIVLFVLIAVSFTVAWFAADTDTNVNEFAIEVKSSDSFQLSLDGVHFEDSITIHLDNKELQIGNETYDSSVQLTDLASVLSTVTNTQGNATYNQLKICSPTKNEDTGYPVTELSAGATWSDAVKSKVTKSGDSYYLSSSSLNTLAQYLELDIWVRSDSNLSVYLGSDSYIYPVTEAEEGADYLPAMASTVITEFGYTKHMYYDNLTNQMYMTTYEDDKGFTYHYKDNYEEEVDTLEFLLKTNINQIENPSTSEFENYTYYYTEDDIYIIKSKNEYVSLPISGTTTPLGQCDVFYGSSNNALFYVSPVSENGYNKRVVYNSLREVVNEDDYIAFFANYGRSFVNYVKTYQLDSYNFEHTFITKTPLQDTYYYNELGELLIHVHDDNGTIKYFDKDSGEVSAPAKPYKVLKESYYGSEDQERVDNVFITKSTKYTFSKNLAAGATLVSFSELLTDQFDENNITVSKEVEDLRTLWNPLPNFSLVTDSITSRYLYDINREETLSYYTYDSATSSYTLNDWESENELLQVGDFQTDSVNVGDGETPILETRVSSGDKYAIKKMRVKIWIDGNDCMAVNSMLNSSHVGNGQIKMCINLVSNINATILTYEPYTYFDGAEDVVVPGKFLVTATKANSAVSAFTFSVSGTWTTSFGDTIATAKVTPVEGSINQVILEFYRYGSVTVYARGNDGRVGSININYDYVKLIKLYDTSKPNEYKIIAVDMYCDKPVEEITYLDYVTEGTWEISDENIASKTVNPDGSLTIRFSGGGEEVVSYGSSKFETLNNTEYYATNSIKFNHTYIVEGGN